MPQPELIRIGRIVATFGLRGGLKLQLAGEFANLLTKGGKLIIAGDAWKIEDVQWHKSQARIWLEGIRRIEDAEILVGSDAAVESEALASQPEEDTYLVRDLVGLYVYDESGALLGKLEEVLKRPANDVYRVGKTLIPAVKEFILNVDLDARRMTVRLLPGMENLA